MLERFRVDRPQTGTSADGAPLTGWAVQIGEIFGERRDMIPREAILSAQIREHSTMRVRIRANAAITPRSRLVALDDAIYAIHGVVPALEGPERGRYADLYCSAGASDGDGN